MEMKKPSINGLILAAGESSRMGDLKQLLQYEGLPFVLQIILKLFYVCNKVTIVLGHKGEFIQEQVEKAFEKNDDDGGQVLFHLNLDKHRANIRFIHNPEYEREMFSSLQCGLESIKEEDWALYHFVDQPGLPISFYEDFALQCNPDYQLIQPVFLQDKGHPILLHKSTFKKIIQSPVHGSLRDYQKKYRPKTKLWDCEYPEILQDIDTFEEYESLTGPDIEGSVGNE